MFALLGKPGFEKETQEKFFVHVSGLMDKVVENDKVSFELERGTKGMNAFSLYHHMRLHNLLNKIPYVVIAQRFEFDSRAMARFHKVDDYFSLPLNIDNLGIRIAFLNK